MRPVLLNNNNNNNNNGKFSLPFIKLKYEGPLDWESCQSYSLNRLKNRLQSRLSAQHAVQTASVLQATNHFTLSTELSTSPGTVESRFNEVPGDQGNWFVLSRFRSIEVLFHTF